MSIKNFLLLILFIGHFANGQNSKLKKANKLFAAKSYVKAAELYKQLPQDEEISQNLGDCYYFNGFMDKASKSYEKAIMNLTLDYKNIIYFRLAHSLYGSGNTKKADSIMTLFKSTSINTIKLKETLKYGAPFDYQVNVINSGNAPGDFALNYFGDKMSFTSIRSENSRTYKWNNKPYLDIFTANYTEEGSLENIEALSSKINTKTHESNAIVTKDGKTIYFSRTNGERKLINDVKVSVVKLYKASIIDGEWDEVETLPFSNDLYSVLHPSLNEDETKLYFASDQPGGYGSYDIYYVEIDSTGSYGQPVNLGPTINTKYREQFPFICKDSTIYFASEGLTGFGGLDIFMCEFNEDEKIFSTPLNLGTTINTGKDDFAFIVNAEENTGFLSSNRSGNDNLYHFVRTENERTFIVEGTVRDINTQEILPNTLVTLFDNNNKIIETIKVGDNGRYKFLTKPKSSYTIEGFRPLYIPTTVKFDTDDSGKIELDVELALESYDDAEDIVIEKDGYVFIQLENIYFELDKWNIKSQAALTLDVLVELMKKYPRMEVQLSAHTDTRSTFEYNMTLSNNRAKSAMEYIISKGIERNRLTSIGYGETQLLVDCGNNCTEDEHSINRRCEFIITK